MNQEVFDLAVPLMICAVCGLGIWWQRRYGKECQLSAKLVKKERRILLFKTRPRPVYLLFFDTEEGKLREISVSKKQFACLEEGQVGTIRFKGRQFMDFVVGGEHDEICL